MEYINLQQLIALKDVLPYFFLFGCSMIVSVMIFDFIWKKSKNIRVKKYIHELYAIYFPISDYRIFDMCPCKGNSNCKIWNCPAYSEKSLIHDKCKKA